MMGDGRLVRLIPPPPEMAAGIKPISLRILPEFWRGRYQTRLEAYRVTKSDHDLQAAAKLKECFEWAENFQSIVKERS